VTPCFWKKRIGRAWVDAPVLLSLVVIMPRFYQKFFILGLDIAPPDLNGL
jgi:hypothetical protein